MNETKIFKTKETAFRARSTKQTHIKYGLREYAFMFFFAVSIDQ